MNPKHPVDALLELLPAGTVLDQAAVARLRAVCDDPAEITGTTTISSMQEKRLPLRAVEMTGTTMPEQAYRIAKHFGPTAAGELRHEPHSVVKDAADPRDAAYHLLKVFRDLKDEDVEPFGAGRLSPRETWLLDQISYLLERPVRRMTREELDAENTSEVSRLRNALRNLVNALYSNAGLISPDNPAFVAAREALK